MIGTLGHKFSSDDSYHDAKHTTPQAPELQKIFELILGQELDRRNFRKKLISLDLIEDTNEFNIGCNGRPAKLYRFKDDIKEIDIF